MNIDLPNYVISIEPHLIKQVTRDNKESEEGIDKFKYKCCIAPKVNSFKKSYFYRTVIQWNLLPLNIRTLETIDEFEIGLKEHMWLILGLEFFGKGRNLQLKVFKFSYLPNNLISVFYNIFYSISILTILVGWRQRH